MKAWLSELFRGRSLTWDQAYALMVDMLDPATTAEAVAAALGALRVRGETADEIAGFSAAMRAAAVPVPDCRVGLMDTCGTGGDAAGTFNVSTATALLLAAAGVPVAKHGNRAVSGRFGSTDVLEALGVPVDLEPEQASRALREHGFVFLFAQRYHPVLARIGAVRRAMGVPTVFNLLGPLANPVPLTYQVLGVYDPIMAPVLAGALAESGLEHAWVVHGDGGLDEIALSGPTRVWEILDGRVRELVVSPEDAGLERAPQEALVGGSDANENAALLEGVLSGVPGPRRDVVLLNAAAGLVVSERAATLAEGAELAARCVDSGAARALLERLRGSR